MQVKATTQFPVTTNLQTVTARPADSFVDSIGICIHMHYNDTAYYDGARLVSYLTDIGIRNVRDGVVWNRPDVYATAHSISNAGIAFNIGVGNGNASDPAADIQNYLNALKDTNMYAGITIKTLEAPNEFDGFSGLGYPQWSDKLYTHEQTVYPIIKADTSLGSLPYIGPSFGTYNGLPLYANDSLYPNRAQYMDAGNLHSYSGGRISESNITAAIATMANVSASKPVYATETGFHTAINTVNSGNYGVDERAQSIYLLRTFLEYFRLGVVRTFSYQLFDQKPNDPGLTDQEEHFGIVAVEGNPSSNVSTWTLRTKPAYSALKRMIATLADVGPGSEPTNLSYAFTNAPSTLRHLLLGRKDGSFDLILWNATPVQADATYNPYQGYVRQNAYTVVDASQKNGVGDSHVVGYVYPIGSSAYNGDQDVEYAKYFAAQTGGGLYPADVPIVITLSTPLAAKSMKPHSDTAFQLLGRGQRIIVALNAEPVVVRLTP